MKDEVERYVVRQIIKDTPKKNTWIDHLRHPLFSVLFGFLLTGVIGAFLSNYFQDQETKRLLQREAFEDIRKFSQALSNRTTEAGYLQSAILRGLGEDAIRNRKKTYDDSVKKWNIELVSNLFTFREYSEARNPIFIERNIEQDLVPLLTVIDICLTQRLDSTRRLRAAQHENSVENAGGSIICKMDTSGAVYSVKLNDIIISARKCGYEISNLLFSWVTINLKSKDQSWKDYAGRVQNEISKMCDVPDGMRIIS